MKYAWNASLLQCCSAVLQCYDVAMQPDNSLDCRMGCWLFTAQKIFALTFLV